MILHMLVLYRMAYRGGGTIADSSLHNKLFYQLSTFVKAFGDLMKSKSVDANDDNVNTLTNNLEQSLVKIVYESLTPIIDGENKKIEDLGIITGPGFINLGSIYGNYIIQFGTADINDSLVTFPISFTDSYFTFALVKARKAVSVSEMYYSTSHTLTGTDFYIEASMNTAVLIYWLVIGK